MQPLQEQGRADHRRIVRHRPGDGAPPRRVSAPASSSPPAMPTPSTRSSARRPQQGAQIAAGAGRCDRPRPVPPGGRGSRRALRQARRPASAPPACRCGPPSRMPTWTCMERVVRVNFFGTMTVTWFALPHVKQTRGSLVAISSLTGKCGTPSYAAYGASKFAVQGLYEALRRELAPDGVHVGVVSPGFVDTPLRDKVLGPDGRPYENAAAAALPRLARRRVRQSHCESHCRPPVRGPVARVRPAAPGPGSGCRRAGSATPSWAASSTGASPPLSASLPRERGEGTLTSPRSRGRLAATGDPNANTAPEGESGRRVAGSGPAPGGARTLPGGTAHLWKRPCFPPQLSQQELQVVSQHSGSPAPAWQPSCTRNGSP